MRVLNYKLTFGVLVCVISVLILDFNMITGTFLSRFVLTIRSLCVTLLQLYHFFKQYMGNILGLNIFCYYTHLQFIFYFKNKI